jgi:hypothetical protein
LLRIIKVVILAIFLLIPYSIHSEELEKIAIPEPNWDVLNTKPSKSTKNGNTEIDIFKLKNKRLKEIDYAWASCIAIGDTCMVVIWIRGTDEDIRITYKGKKNKNLCTVYISNSDFEKYFKYSFLAGISTDTNDKFTTSFGGGPAGDREEYWFEWSDHVKPSFYCVLK